MRSRQCKKRVWFVRLDTGLLAVGVGVVMVRWDHRAWKTVDCLCLSSCCLSGVAAVFSKYQINAAECGRMTHPHLRLARLLSVHASNSNIAQ
jgi:hypothetical protein